jgi:nicotinamide mononucleotide transporter
MADFAEVVLNSARETDIITWIATFAGVVYVLLALRESVWCWSFGIVGSALSVSIMLNERLYYDALLNIFYVILGVYGWIQWAKEKNNEHGVNPNPAVVISKIPSDRLFICVSAGVVFGIVMGYVSNYVKENSFTYSDALLTSFSVVATWMTAKKYIENWIFWIVIDAAYVVLFYFKGPQMYLFALLFIFYTFMALAGYFAWRKSIKA